MEHSSEPSESPPTLAPPPRRGLSITHKLVALIVLTSGAIVLFLASYLPTQQIRASRAALETKAATYGRLVSKQVASAIAFDDRATAREVFDSVAQDPDVESLVLMTAAGTTLHARGVPGAWIAAARRGVIEQRVVELEDRIAVVTPVIAAEGPRGTLVIELSTRGLVTANTKVVRTAVLAGGLALVIGVLFAYAIARSLGGRLAQMGRVAGAVSEGSLDQSPVTVSGSDEIALLGHAFNAMLHHIQSLIEQMRRNSEGEQIRLEGLVQAFTLKLDRRVADMRLVLDKVGQGLFSVDCAGRLLPERSAIVARWLGEPRKRDSLFTWLDRSFPGKGEAFRAGWTALNEDSMSLAMRIAQLPSEVEGGGQRFEFAYEPVFEADVLSRLLVVMTDVTPLGDKKRIADNEAADHNEASHDALPPARGIRHAG
jgi:HAMP domain-containing protein